MRFSSKCYRRIVEQDAEFNPSKPMRPARLRQLLQQRIFGIDRDEGGLPSCRTQPQLDFTRLRRPTRLDEVCNFPVTKSTAKTFSMETSLIGSRLAVNDRGEEIRLDRWQPALG
ncbi:MAG: hypothetical protein R3C56_34165 [Pirellulaceae bacterium]